VRRRVHHHRVRRFEGNGQAVVLVGTLSESLTEGLGHGRDSGPAAKGRIDVALKVKTGEAARFAGISRKTAGSARMAPQGHLLHWVQKDDSSLFGSLLVGHLGHHGGLVRV